MLCIIIIYFYFAGGGVKTGAGGREMRNAHNKTDALEANLTYRVVSGPETEFHLH